MNRTHTNQHEAEFPQQKVFVGVQSHGAAPLNNNCDTVSGFKFVLLDI